MLRCQRKEADYDNCSAYCSQMTKSIEIWKVHNSRAHSVIYLLWRRTQMWHDSTKDFSPFSQKCNSFLFGKLPCLQKVHTKLNVFRENDKQMVFVCTPASFDRKLLLLSWWQFEFWQFSDLESVRTQVQRTHSPKMIKMIISQLQPGNIDRRWNFFIYFISSKLLCS